MQEDYCLLLPRWFLLPDCWMSPRYLKTRICILMVAIPRRSPHIPSAGLIEVDVVSDAGPQVLVHGHGYDRCGDLARIFGKEGDGIVRLCDPVHGTGTDQ